MAARVSFIGAGKVGCSLARYLAAGPVQGQKDVELAGFFSASAESARAAADFAGGRAFASAEEAAREAERRAEAEGKAMLLKNKGVTLQVKCGETGRLYGSVTTAEIAAELEKQYGIAVDKKKIELSEPIKQVGDVTMSVWLYSGITTPMVVHIVPKEK